MSKIIRLNDACDSYWSVIAEQTALLARYAHEAGRGKLIEAECTVISSWCTDILRINGSQRRDYAPENDDELLGLVTKIAQLVEPKTFLESTPHWQPAMLQTVRRLNLAVTMRMQDRARSVDQQQKQSEQQELRKSRAA